MSNRISLRLALDPRSPRLDLAGRILTIAAVTVRRMDHVGIVVDDLAAATAFFEQLGLEVRGQIELEGETVDRIVGLDGVRTEVAFLRTPDGHGQIELTKFQAPPYEGHAGDEHEPSNAPGLRHLTFAVEDIDAVVARLQALGAELVGGLEQYEDSYRLCYIRGPAGIIVESAEAIS